MSSGFSFLYDTQPLTFQNDKSSILDSSAVRQSKGYLHQSEVRLQRYPRSTVSSDQVSKSGMRRGVTMPRLLHLTSIKDSKKRMLRKNSYNVQVQSLGQSKRDVRHLLANVTNHLASRRLLGPIMYAIPLALSIDGHYGQLLVSRRYTISFRSNLCWIRTSNQNNWLFYPGTSSDRRCLYDFAVTSGINSCPDLILSIQVILDVGEHLSASFIIDTRYFFLARQPSWFGTG